jgi:hypothetical protein
MKYLTIEKLKYGIRIKDSLNDKYITYCDYTLKQAIKKHREYFNLKYKHFEIIYI